MAHPLDNALPLALGDIIVSLTHNGRKYVFGPGVDQYPVGTPLWKINPLDDCNNVVKLAIIRSPGTNSNIETIRVRLNETYDPVYEKPDTDNRIFGAGDDFVDFVSYAFDPVNQANAFVSIVDDLFGNLF